MKNALILHGTDATSKDNWFEWLRLELEKRGWHAWVPDLPKADKPSVQRYCDYLFRATKWDFNSESILIGHSSGAVAILGILQNLPEGVTVDTCYLVGAFKDDLGWDSLGELFAAPFDFGKIKKRARRFVFIHSNDDPHCPLDGAQYLAKMVGGELLVQKGQKHFSVGTYGEAYRKFPFLLEVVEGKSSASLQ